MDMDIEDYPVTPLAGFPVRNFKRSIIRSLLRVKLKKRSFLCELCVLCGEKNHAELICGIDSLPSGQ